MVRLEDNAERGQTSAIEQRFQQHVNGDYDRFLTQLGRALCAARTITYAQGLALLVVASDKYDFGAHTYERIDAKGTFHTEWEEE